MSKRKLLAAVLVAAFVLPWAGVAQAYEEQFEVHPRSAIVERGKPVCKDRLALWLKQAGFRGKNLKVAWAVAMRESNGQPGESTWPDLGLFQLNSPSWQGSKYWPANVYDPIQNARAVKRMVKDMNWQPWGMRVSKGRVSYDYSSYGGWSQWQRYNWIVAPYERYAAQFPRRCG